MDDYLLLLAKSQTYLGAKFKKCGFPFDCIATGVEVCFYYMGTGIEGTYLGR